MTQKRKSLREESGWQSVQELFSGIRCIFEAIKIVFDCLSHMDPNRRLQPNLFNTDPPDILEVLSLLFFPHPY